MKVKCIYKILGLLLIIAILIMLIIIIAFKTNESRNIDTSSSSNTKELNFTIEDSKVLTFARFEATVEGSDTDSIPVVTLRRDDITTDDITFFADTFYDNSDYHNQLPIDEYSVSDLDNIIDKYYAYIDKVDTSKDISADLRNLSEDQIISIINEDIDFAINLRSTAPDNNNYQRNIAYTPLNGGNNYTISPNRFTYEVISTCSYGVDSEQEICYLEGTRNNLPYYLQFSKSDLTGSTFMKIKMNSPDTIVWKDYTSDEVSYHYHYNSLPPIFTNYTPEENDCIYSKEEAIALCDNLLEELTINNMKPINVSDLYVTAALTPYSAAVDKGTCGYYISYGKVVDNKSVNYSNYHTESPADLCFDRDEDGNILDTSNIEYGNEVLNFAVMDCGIVYMDYYFPTNIEEISSAYPPLLSFDDILSVFEDDIITNYENYISEVGESESLRNAERERFSKLNTIITKVKLGLARVTIDSQNGEYSLIPVWSFYIEDSDSASITINAIDGSFIDTSTGYVME